MRAGGERGGVKKSGRAAVSDSGSTAPTPRCPGAKRPVGRGRAEEARCSADESLTLCSLQPCLSPILSQQPRRGLDTEPERGRVHSIVA